MEKEYLSIKDFANEVGVSQQAIYKQLNNKLKPYLRVVENKKMLEKTALSLFSKDEKCNEVEQQLINFLQTELNVLRSELNAKNEQIRELQKALEKEQHSLSQAQMLNAMDKQKILELEDKQQKNSEKKKWWQLKK